MIVRRAAQAFCRASPCRRQDRQSHQASSRRRSNTRTLVVYAEIGNNRLRGGRVTIIGYDLRKIHRPCRGSDVRRRARASCHVDGYRRFTPGARPRVILPLQQPARPSRNRKQQPAIVLLLQRAMSRRDLRVKARSACLCGPIQRGGKNQRFRPWATAGYNQKQRHRLIAGGCDRIPRRTAVVGFEQPAPLFLVGRR